jgi:hypothetical protein
MGLETEGFQKRRLEVDFFFRLSRESGNPGSASLPSATTLDARLRGHDGLSLRLKARNFNHPRSRR